MLLLVSNHSLYILHYHTSAKVLLVVMIYVN